MSVVYDDSQESTIFSTSGIRICRTQLTLPNIESVLSTQLVFVGLVETAFLPCHQPLLSQSARVLQTPSGGIDVDRFPFLGQQLQMILP